MNNQIAKDATKVLGGAMKMNDPKFTQEIVESITTRFGHGKANAIVLAAIEWGQGNEESAMEIIDYRIK